MNSHLISKLMLRPKATLKEVVQVIQNGAKQIALITDEDLKLVGLVTDGDVRRGILNGANGDTLAEVFMQKSFESISDQETTERAFQLMRDHKRQHLPVLDAQGRIVDVIWLSDFIQDHVAVPAVVMAGGFGKRLHPLTLETPKPMLPIAGKPLIERTIEQLRSSGIQQVSITTHYKGEQIKNHFQNGENFGVDINYIEEESPLGTAGSLAKMCSHGKPYLVINGDIITGINYRSLIDYHRQHHADLTIVVRQFDVKVPYGVVQAEGVDVVRIVEKPVYNFFVNGGIYLIGQEAHALIHEGDHLDMPDLVSRCIANGKKVVSYPMTEYWIDIGNPQDYETAQRVMEEKECI